MIHPAKGRSGRSSHRGLQITPAALLLVSGVAVWPQQGAAQGRAVSIVPSASVSETVTNNAMLSTHDRRSDATTTLTAGISLSSRSGRVQGVLDYRLSGSIRARETAANNTANTLNASLRADVVDNWLSVNANAQIGQQAISAFGLQSNDVSIDNPNRTEQRAISITPTVRGRAGPWANYNAQYTHSQQWSSASTSGDSSSDSASVALSSAGDSPVG